MFVRRLAEIILQRL